MLISDSCPDSRCSVPLVRNKAGEVYCIGCEKFCDLNAQIDETNLSSSLASLGESRDSDLGVLNSLPAASYGTPASQPYASRPATTPAQSTFIPPTPPPLPAMVQAPSLSRDSEQSESRSERGGEFSSNSAEIAQKLLQGWNLLNEYCPAPNCNLPLVKNKDGQMYCVQCQEWVISEDDFDPSQHQPLDFVSATPGGDCHSLNPPALPRPKAVPSTAPSKSKAAMPDTPSSMMAEGPSSAHKLLHTPYTPAPGEVKEGRQHSIVPTPIQLFETPKKAPLPLATSSEAQVLQQQVMPANSHLTLAITDDQATSLDMRSLEQTLLNKIEGAHISLAATSNVQDCRALCSLITEAAQALQAVRGVHM